jgi:methionyl-tRNA synthetase
MKIYRKAEEQNIDTQKYVDGYAKKFDDLKQSLNLSYNSFTRTTDEHHIKSAQEFWKRCYANGDIYKKNYKVKYCVGCELEKTESELDDKGCCPEHPNLEIEIIEEENYFFKWSNYEKKLLDFYEKNPDFVVPDFRFNEIKKFVERGLQDFSISRLKEKMPWGVSVPDDENHVMYVWFDALVNYVSCLGWPEDDDKFVEYWGTEKNRNAIQVAGKDNLRQQSAMWQAMLMSAGLPLTKQIYIFGFVNSGGQKMSKSLGNVVNPFDLVNEYSTDVVRYYIARHLNTYEDSDFTMEKFKEIYNANLANGLGNLVSRVMKMAEQHLNNPVSSDLILRKSKALEDFDFNQYMNIVWIEIAKADKLIQEEQPFRIVKEDKEKAKEIITDLIYKLYNIAVLLEPVMPETSEKIQKLIKENKSPDKPLFLRK